MASDDAGNAQKVSQSPPPIENGGNDEGAGQDGEGNRKEITRTSKGIGWNAKSLVSFGAACVGVVVLTISLMSHIVEFNVRHLNITERTQDEIGKLTNIADIQAKRILYISDLIDRMQKQIDSLSTIPREGALSSQLQQLKSIAADLSGRETKLESIILANPSKALDLILLRHDLENIKTTQQSNYISLKDDFEHVYDLSKWLIGALAVGIIMLAIGNLKRGNQQ